jgi:hypothetical protein
MVLMVPQPVNHTALAKTANFNHFMDTRILFS